MSSYRTIANIYTNARRIHTSAQRVIREWKRRDQADLSTEASQSAKIKGRQKNE